MSRPQQPAASWANVPAASAAPIASSFSGAVQSKLALSASPGEVGAGWGAVGVTEHALSTTRRSAPAEIARVFRMECVYQSSRRSDREQLIAKRKPKSVALPTFATDSSQHAETTRVDPVSASECVRRGREPGQRLSGEVRVAVPARTSTCQENRCASTPTPRRGAHDGYIGCL